MQTLTATLPISVTAGSSPLLGPQDLTYLGAFRVPQGDVGGGRFYGGSQKGWVIGHCPQHNSLYITGHPVDMELCEIDIPTLKTGAINTLNTASLLQNFCDPENIIPNNYISNHPAAVEFKVGGILERNGELIGSAYEFYDGSGHVTHSHFKFFSLNLTSAVTGLFQLGTQGGGYVGGYMCHVPPEWQAALGYPCLTGQCCLSILGRTSAGPAAYGLDPATLSSGSPVTTTAFVSYPIAHPMNGGADPNLTTSEVCNGTTGIQGIVFPPGKRSILFFGSHGVGPIYYGDAGAGDPNRGDKGYHCQGGNYRYQVWAYDVLDFIAVKNGQKQSWEVMPYTWWSFTLPYPNGAKWAGGATFDPASRRIYLAQVGGESGGYPVIHCYGVAA